MEGELFRAEEDYFWRDLWIEDGSRMEVAAEAFQPNFFNKLLPGLLTCAAEARLLI